MAACHIMWGLQCGHWAPLCVRRAESTFVSQRTCESWFQVFFFLVFSSSLSFKSIYWLPIGCRSILLKPISFLFLGLCFWVRSPQDCFPFTDWLEHTRIGSLLKIPLPCPSSPNDSSTLPRGNSSIMAGCLTGRGLMTGALYWPDCHTLKIWSQSPFLKTCQMITKKFLFAQRVEHFLFLFKVLRRIYMFIQMISRRMKLNIMEGDKWV